jgi:hypothetical protein
MADTLDINSIERGAAKQIEIAKRVRELTTLVNEVFPGYSVNIERLKGGKRTGSVNTGDFASLPLLEQVETVLRDVKRPMQKRNLLKAIHRRGGNVSENTLSIYLSRYDQFVNRGRGKWSVNRSNGSEATK